MMMRKRDYAVEVSGKGRALGATIALKNIKLGGLGAPGKKQNKQERQRKKKQIKKIGIGKFSIREFPLYVLPNVAFYIDPDLQYMCIESF